MESEKKAGSSTGKSKGRGNGNIKGRGKGKGKGGGRAGKSSRSKPRKGGILTAADLEAMAQEGREQLELQMAYGKYSDDPMENPRDGGIAWARVDARAAISGSLRRGHHHQHPTAAAAAAAAAVRSLPIAHSSTGPPEAPLSSTSSSMSRDAASALRATSWRNSDAIDRRPLVMFDTTRVTVPRFPSEEFSWKQLGNLGSRGT